MTLRRACAAWGFVTFLIVAQSALAAAKRYDATDIPRSIPDLGNVTSKVTINDAGVITDIDVEVTIDHGWDSDLTAELISPSGQSVQLFADVGFGGDNFTATILDDEATQAIKDGTPPFTGRFRPEQALSRFDGLDGTGTWQLKVSDTGWMVSGTLKSWALIVNGGVTPPACTPPAAPTNPNPADKATQVSVNAKLSWGGNPGAVPLRLFASTGDSFELVELKTDPAAQETSIGGIGYFPALDFAPDGTLWGAGSRLCRINPADGSSATVCTSLRTPAGKTVTLNGIAFHPDGTAYGVNWDSSTYASVFYRIDTATCTATELCRIPDSQGSIWGIDFSPSGVLYGVGFDLVTFDLAACRATIVRSGGLPLLLADMDWAGDGFIYAVSFDSKTLCKIDPATGAIAKEYGPYTSELWGVASQGGGAAAGNLTQATVGPQVREAAAPAIQGEELRLAMAQVGAAKAEQNYRMATRAAAETENVQGLAAQSDVAALAADTITCDVLLDTVNPPVKSVCTDTVTSECDPHGLKPCTTYYWQVVARKACTGGGSASTPGPIWSFTTEFSVADLDKDCDVDFDDFSIFASQWLSGVE